MLKVSNKDTNYWIQTYLTPRSSVSVANFEYVNAGWEHVVLLLNTCLNACFQRGFLCKFCHKVSIYLFLANTNLGSSCSVFFKAQRNSRHSVKIEAWFSQRRNLAVQIRVILTPKRRKDTTEYSDSDTSIHHM